MSISYNELAGGGHGDFAPFNDLCHEGHTGLAPRQQFLLKNRKVGRQTATTNQMFHDGTQKGGLRTADNRITNHVHFSNLKLEHSPTG